MPLLDARSLPRGLNPQMSSNETAAAEYSFPRPMIFPDNDGLTSYIFFKAKHGVARSLGVIVDRASAICPVFSQGNWVRAC